jgi:hypothetical protein
MSKQTKQQQITKLKETLEHWDIPFKFTASPELYELIIKNEHPFAKDLPQSFKTLFLQGEPLMISTKMVLDYVDNKIDEKNKWLLNRGTIASFDNHIIILKENT